MLLLSLLSSALAGPVLVEAGVGLPEILHASGGVYVHPRLSVEARYGNVVFNHLVGAGVHAYLLGDASDQPAPHSLPVGLQALINPVHPFDGGGEIIGEELLVSAGYQYFGAKGLVLRAQAGAIFYNDGGFAAGPHLVLGIGYAR